MNTLSYLPTAQQAAALMPQQLKARISELIDECLNHRSASGADAIVQHVEWLCTHPDYQGSWEERCAYRCLARRWRCLAWLAADQSG